MLSFVEETKRVAFLINTITTIRPETPDEASVFLSGLASAPSRTAYSNSIGITRWACKRWEKHCHNILNGFQGVPEGHFIKGVSYLEDMTTGEQRLRWVKTNIEAEQQHTVMQEALAALLSQIIPSDPAPSPHHTISNLLSCYVVTDYHFGQLSWGRETGADWSAEIAEEMLVRWFSAAISQAPASHTAIFAQVGDLLHYDSLDAITPTSGHVLDADTRFPKVVNMVIRVIRKVIAMLLEKHEHVHVLMAEGNHDMASSVWLRAMFSAFYENEPRVTVDDTPVPYYVYEWGDTSLFFHHGHKKKISDLSKVFAGMYRDVYGRTRYSYAHTGHLHHVDMKEDQIMILEQHPTLAAKDAHSARGGYISMRGANVITYSKTSGEVSRCTVRPEMLI